MEGGNHFFAKNQSRDCCLSLVEAWYYGNAKGIAKVTKLPFFENQLFYIFANTDGLVTSYIDVSVLGEGTKVLHDFLIQDSSFIKKLFIEYDRHLIYLRNAWNKEYLETEQELFEFLEAIKQSWVYTALAYYIPIIPGLASEDVDLANRYRTENDMYLDASDNILRATIRHLFPLAAGLEKYLLLNEIVENRLPKQDELEKRRQHYIYTDFKLFVDKTLDDLATQYSFEIEKEEVLPVGISDFKGETASPGMARGKVRILLLKDQLNDLKEGEILVTTMTTPDFVTAMNKAVAIITDEGGITCHAAIISREMNKPCIIGTKIASKVLHDGDEVEVDADKGIVKIIKR
ncbi:MAG: PEP-utilizing enzyme [Patescibacteria group bacterium]